MSATAVDPRGLKRICMSCGVRFYDLNKRPIICPSCDTEFDGEIKVKSRRGRAAVVEKEVPEDTDSKLAKKKPVNENEDEDEIEDEDDGVEVVSLDDAEDDSDQFNIYGEFYSQHETSDITKWLKSRNVGKSLHDFEVVFGLRYQ